MPLNLVAQSGLIVEQRTRIVFASAELVYKCFAGIGNGRGWYYATIFGNYEAYLVDCLAVLD